jgi:hypothetical protein
MMYMDTMVVRREAKAQMEKVEKLRKSIEDERKKDDGKTGSQVGPN